MGRERARGRTQRGGGERNIKKAYISPSCFDQVKHEKGCNTLEWQQSEAIDAVISAWGGCAEG